MDKIIEASDVLDVARDCIECVCRAAESLEIRDRGPFIRVADIANTKIDEAVALLDEYLKANDARRVQPTGTASANEEE